MPKRIALTGTTGFIGPHVLDRLLADSHTVSCLVRPGRAYEPVPGVRYCEGRLEDQDSLKSLLEGVETVVHLAGRTRAKTEEEYREINCTSVERLMETAHAQSSSFGHIIAMSSLAAMGPARDETGEDENAPMRPITPYGRSKAELEAMLRRGQDRTDWTAIRAPGVYGPGDRDFFQYFKLVSKGWRVTLGKRTVMSLVYVKHLADAIAACVEEPDARNQAFFIADDGCYDWDDLAAMMEAAFGRSTVHIRVPFFAVQLLSLLSGLAEPFVKKPLLLNKHKLAEMSQEFWTATTDKAKKLLRYNPTFATADAIRVTAAWYKDQGWL